MKKMLLLLILTQIICSLLFADKIKVGSSIGTTAIVDGLVDSPVYSLKANILLNNNYDLIFKFENFNIKQDYYVTEFQKNIYKSNLKNYLVGFEYKEKQSKKVTNVFGFCAGIGSINKKLYSNLINYDVSFQTSWTAYVPMFEVNAGTNYELTNKIFLYIDLGYRYEKFYKSSFGKDNKYNKYEIDKLNTSGIFLNFGLKYKF
jgi:hypothetical protein